MHDFIIIGGGIFGMSTAVELAKRKYKVGLLNPDTIPHHLAASTDITKVVRMEYGTDEEYFKMAEQCIGIWKSWNELFEEEVYHEVGFLMLCREGLNSERSAYERHSYEMLRKHGYRPDRIHSDEIREMYPEVNADLYAKAVYNPNGGYVRSARAISCLANYARSLGVDIYEGQTAQELVCSQGRLTEVRTKEGEIYPCGHAIVAAGAHTPYLIPELQPYMKATGHPVFWLRPLQSADFMSERLPVFMADIAHTGWYGFPYLSPHGVVKIAKHSDGVSLHPDQDDRVVTDSDIVDMRSFVSSSFPALADAPLVYTRRCLYTDTLDGHFWIDRHPGIEGLTVSSGGCGHGMKMGPVIGEMTADVAEGKKHRYSDRYDWRHIETGEGQKEEARYMAE